MTDISICIATFKRPEKLGRLLDSIDKHCPEKPKIEIVVVDNDPVASARLTLENYKLNGKFSLITGHQPEPNISLTRNMTIDLSTGQLIAFLDDDEYVLDNWLNHLLETKEQFSADVVFGPVERVLPLSGTKWLLEGGFFDRKSFKNGEPRKWGGAGNTLVKASLFKNEGFRFDHSFGLTGGEDAQLFFQMHLKGKRLVWCEHAKVMEDLDDNRLSAKWLVKRSFSSGQSFSRLTLPSESFPKQIFVQSKQALIMGGYGLLFPLGFLFGRAAALKLLLRAALSAGRFFYSGALLSKTYEAESHAN